MAADTGLLYRENIIKYLNGVDSFMTEVKEIGGFSDRFCLLHRDHMEQYIKSYKKETEILRNKIEKRESIENIFAVAFQIDIIISALDDNIGQTDQISRDILSKIYNLESPAGFILDSLSYNHYTRHGLRTLTDEEIFALARQNAICLSYYLSEITYGINAEIYRRANFIYTKLITYVRYDDNGLLILGLIQEKTNEINELSNHIAHLKRRCKGFNDHFNVTGMMNLLKYNIHSRCRDAGKMIDLKKPYLGRVL